MSAPQPAVMERRYSRRVRFADFFELTKPGITTMVLITTLVGYYMASRNGLRPLLLLHTILGTALVAGGASGLNQYFERNLDARMHRTRNRPLPAGRLFPNEALFFSMIISVVGVADLMFFVNILTGVLGLMTLAAYIFVYTPLKTRTALCTLIGAFPGATPPVMGWTAAGGDIDAVALSLFAILFLWQMPHFFAIAWMCREDYLRAGFRMISSDDSSGERSASQSVFFCILLLVLAGLPAFVGIASYVYQPIELVLGGLFVAVAMRFLRLRTPSAARLLFFASIAYLPLLLAALVLTKL